jgi:hypothetical protein
MPMGAAAQVLWDNGAADELVLSSQLDTVYPFHSQTADDFVLPTGPGGVTEYRIDEVRWTGGYWSGPGPGRFDFNLLFYADRGDGNAPTGGPVDPTATALAEFFFANAEVHETEVGPLRYTYAVELPEPVFVLAETRYWLAVQGVGSFPPNWGRAVTAGLMEHEAVIGHSELGLDYWTDTTAAFGTAYDLAFTLVGGPAGDLCGDANCDGTFNGADIDHFFQALGDPGGWRATHTCDLLDTCDINGDGAANGADIDPFFEGLGSGACP